MTTTLLIALLAVAAFYLGWRRALAKSDGSIANLHSKPGHYAWYVALLCAGPALAVWLTWALFGDLVLRWVVASRLPAGVAEQSPAMLSFFFDDVRRMAAGLPPNMEPNDAMRAAADLWRQLEGIATVAFMAAALSLAGAGIAIGLGRIERELSRAQPRRAVGLDRAAADRGGLDHDHRGDRVLGAVRIDPVFRARADREFPVRAGVEPADRDPRRPGRRVGQLRRGAAVLPARC